MGITSGDLQILLGIIGEAESFKPVFDTAIKAASIYLPDIKAGLESLLKWHREKTVEAFKFYMDNGFTREESMLLILSSRVAMERAIHNTGKK